MISEQVKVKGCFHAFDLLVVFNVLVILYAVEFQGSVTSIPRCLMYFFHIAAELPCL